MAVFRTKKPHEYEMNSTNQKHVWRRVYAYAYYKSRDITSFSSSKMAGSSCDDDLLRESLSYAANKLGIPNGKFRELQESAIRSVIEAGRDIFVALPTGFGKSAIYQAIPLCCDFLRDHGFYDHDDSSRCRWQNESTAVKTTGTTRGNH